MAKKSLVLQRSRWDIMATVLEIAKRPESKTHVMYRANLSFRQLERYLELLLEKGFLKVLEASQSRAAKLFVTTEKGLSFLEAYHRLEEIVSGKKVASTFGFP
ncbi:MAG: winged helix-turn-helix domain-containing protein [Candidatus Bathyarchaeota archaeon]|nr:winged helix-turn-helix domain-containing protein [Candidatus Bathyarchaeota archaeon]MDH5779974.1 winged helix-turn-helix domain-containing protein [Candidatus Bathyarchaeota archaeon]